MAFRFELLKTDLSGAGGFEYRALRWRLLSPTVRHTLPANREVHMEILLQRSFPRSSIVIALLVAAGAARWLVPATLSLFLGEDSQAQIPTAVIQILLLVGAGLALHRIRGHGSPREIGTSVKTATTLADVEVTADPPRNPEFGSYYEATLAVREIGDVAVLDMAGQFGDQDVSSRLTQQIDSLLHTQRRRFLVNTGDSQWSECTLQALLISLRLVQSHGGVIKLVVHKEHTAGALRVSGIGSLFEIYATESEALPSFSQRG